MLRSLLVIGTFLGLVLLWSSLTPKPGDDNPFAAGLVKYRFYFNRSITCFTALPRLLIEFCGGIQHCRLAQRLAC